MHRDCHMHFHYNNELACVLHVFKFQNDAMSHWNAKYTMLGILFIDYFYLLIICNENWPMHIHYNKLT